MAQIVHLITGRIVDSLTLEMITNVPENDPTRISLIKRGRFQENPLKYPSSLWISGGDSTNPTYADGRIGVKDMEDLGYYIPSGEVGGGHLWWRRGMVELGFYFVQKRYVQDEADDYAHRMFGKAQSYLDSVYVSDLRDEFGEHAIQMSTYQSNFFESGGPPDQYIWRGQIKWQVLTERAV